MNDAHLEFLASDAWKKILEGDLLPWLEQVVDLGDHVLEVGPGPGLTTDILRALAPRVTAVELDGELARALADRLRGTNVEVVNGDAAAIGWPADSFSAATCFSMLHHVPSADEQDRVLAEIHRVLRPGAALVATDSRDHPGVRAFHEGDVFNPMDDDQIETRLLRAGFVDINVRLGDYDFRFAAHKPI